MKPSHSKRGGTCTRVNVGLICLMGVAAALALPARADTR